MIRLTKLADYGVVLMSQVARKAPEASFTAGALALQLGMPLPTVSKLLKRLTRGGLLVSQQGAKGGYSLARDPGEISVADLVEVLEGPVALTECVAEGPCGCRHEAKCSLRSHWQLINDRIVNTLRMIPLSEIAREKTK